MEVTLLLSTTWYQAHLQLALDDSVAGYEDTHRRIECLPAMTEETATVEGTLLHYKLEQQRATALVLAACCVEALANLYLIHKATPEQFALLERGKFLEKWLVMPSFFIPDYSLAKDSVLYQDLKRLNSARNALVHLKERIIKHDTEIHPGSLPNIGSDEHIFIGRCRSLPDRLLAHLASFDKTGAIANVDQTLMGVFLMREMRRLASKQEPEHNASDPSSNAGHQADG